MGFWRYLGTIAWREASLLAKWGYFIGLFVGGSLPMSIGQLLGVDVPIWAAVLTAIIGVLIVLSVRLINKSKALEEKIQPKLSATLKPGEMVAEDSLSSRAIAKIYRIVLKNEGAEPIKRGNLIYSKLHFPEGYQRNVRIEPANKFVKQREDGSLIKGRGIVPQKTHFSLNRGEEIEFDAFMVREFHVEGTKAFPQLIYYGVSESTGLYERVCHLSERKTYFIEFKATSDTGGALDVVVKLKFEDIGKPIEVCKEKPNVSQ